jgi:hypothetical protein
LYLQFHVTLCSTVGHIMLGFVYFVTVYQCGVVLITSTEKTMNDEVKIMFSG